MMSSCTAIERSLLLFLACVLLALPSPARASDPGKPGAQAAPSGLPSATGKLGSPGRNVLRFQVPMELKNMLLPSNLHPTVGCEVEDASGNILGRGRTQVSLDASDGYNGTVLVVVEPKPGKAFGLGTDWQCSLTFQNEAGDAIYAATESSSAQFFQRAKPGTTFVKIVQGKFTP